MKQFYLHGNEFSDKLTGQYYFEHDGIRTVVRAEISNALTDLKEDPFYEAISDENMPENFVLGKSINEYWMDVLKADVEAGKVDDPSTGSEPYNHMRGNYYPITEKVSVVYEGEYIKLYGGYGPVIHLNMDETIQIWVIPHRMDREMTTTQLYEIFRANSPVMDRLLTKSTSKEAAEELYNLWKNALK